MESQDEDVVEALVAAIEEHREFRQLSCYSVECVAKALDPSKNSRWREVTERAVESGAASAVLGVLERYPGSDDVLGRCAECLGMIVASDAAAAAFVAEGGHGLAVVFGSIEVGGAELSERSVSGALYLVEAMISHPEILSRIDCEELVSTLVLIMSERRREPSVCLACVRGMERLSRSVQLRQVLAISDAIKSLLDTVELSVELSADASLAEREMLNSIAMNATKILLKLCHGSDDTMRLVHNLCTGDIFMRLLASPTAANDGTLKRLAGRLLSQLLERNSSSLVGLLRNEHACDEEAVQNLNLLHTLAKCNSSYLDDLTHDDIRTLLGMLSQNRVERAMDALTDVLLLLCSSKSGSNKIVGAGGVRTLTDVLSSGNASDLAMIGALETLNAVLASTSVLTDDMVNSILWANLSVLSRFSERVTLIATTLKCLGGILATGGIATQSICIGSDDIPIVINAMTLHQREEKAQIYGTRLLLRAFSSPELDLSPCKDEFAALCEVVIANSSTTRGAPGDLLLPSLQLLLHLVDYDECKSYVKRKAGINTISKVLVKNVSSDNVTSIAVDLMEKLSSNELTKKLVEDLASFTKNGCTADNAAFVASTVETLGCVSLNPRGMDSVIEQDGFTLLISAFVRVARAQDYKEETIALSLAETFTVIIWRSKPVREYLDGTRILACAAKILRSSRKGLFKPCLQLARDVYALCGSCNVLKSGIVDGAAVALAARSSDSTVHSSAVDLLIRLAKDGYCDRILKTSAVRQMHALVRQIVGESGCLSLLGKILLFFGEVGKDTNGAEILRRCGSIEIIVSAMKGQAVQIDLIQLGQIALSNLVTSGDVVNSTDRVRKMALSPSDALSLSDAQQAVVEMSVLAICREPDDQALADRAVDTIFKIVKAVSSLSRSPSLAHFNTTCLEMICRFKNARFSVLLLTDLVEALFRDFDSNASLDLCRTVLSLTSNTEASALLPYEKVAGMLLAMVQKSDLDLELSCWACKSLLALCQQNSSSVDIIAGFGAVYHLCDFISYAVKEKNTSGVSDALRLMHMVGKSSTKLLINDQVMDALSDILGCFSEGMCDSLIFAEMAKVTLAVASEKMNGVENISRLLSDACLFVLANGTLQDCDVLIGMIPLLAKSDRVMFELKRSGLTEALAAFLRDFPVDSANWPIVSKAFHALERDGCQYSLVDAINSLANVPCSPSGSTSFCKFVSLLELCCDLLFGCEALDESQSLALSRCLCNTLDMIRRLDNRHCHRKVRALCLTICHRMMLLRVDNDEGVHFALEECNELVSGHLSVYRAIAYAFLSSVVARKEGLRIIGQAENIPTFMDASLLTRDRCQAELRRDKVCARKLVDTVSDQILEQVCDLVDDEIDSHALAIGPILLCLDDTCKRKICLEIIKSDANINMMFGILGTFLQPSLQLNAVQLVVDVLSKENAESCIVTGAHSRHIDTICAICRRIPAAVFLFSFFSKSDEGINELVADPEPLKLIARLLSYGEEEHQYAAASVLSDFLAATPLLLDAVKDGGVPVLLLRILRVPSASKPGFVQDSMHIMGTLVSHFGSSELNLSSQWVDCLESILDTFGDDEYISGVATDMLSDLREKLKEDDDIAGSLGVLASALTGTESAPSHVKTEVDDASIEPHFKVMDQLRLLTGVADNIDRDNVALDMQLATPLIEILGRYPNERGMLTMALATLRKIGDDKWVARVIEENRRLVSLANILKKKNESSLNEMVLRILACVPWKVEAEKEVLLSNQTMAAISETIISGCSVVGLVESGFCAISNLLACGGKDVTDCYTNGGVDAAIKASIAACKESHGTIHVILQCLYDMVKTSERREVFKEIPELVSLLDKFINDSVLVSLILRILGILSVSDGNVLKMIKCNTVRVIVGNMQQHYMNDPCILQLAVMLLSNFGAVQNEEEKSGIVCISSEQGGQAFLFRCIGMHCTERALMDATLMAMFNLGNLNSSSATAFDVDVLRITLQVMIALEYDPDVLLKGLKIVTALTLYDGCLELLNEMDGLSFLVSIIARHIRCENLVELACLSLANSLTSKGAQETIRARERDYARTLLDCLGTHRGNLQTTKYLLAAFALLAQKRIALDSISREGLHLFVGLSHRFLHDRATTEYLIEIIGQISFAESYVPDIVQTGCIKLLLHVLNVYTQTQALVVGVLRSILIIMKSSDEAKVILSEAGGETFVEQAVNLHSEISVQRAGGKILRRLRDENAIENYRLSFLAEQRRFSQGSMSLRSDLETGRSRRWSLLSISDRLEDSCRSLLIPV